MKSHIIRVFSSLIVTVWLFSGVLTMMGGGVA